MIKDTYYPQLYKCDSCDQINRIYVWSSEVEELRPKCTCGRQMTYQNMYTTDVEVFNIGTKMTKSQIVTDRKKRSTEHFKKDIMPTLPKKDRSHFTRKYSK